MVPDIGLDKDESVCPLTGYTYMTEMGECPHHYDGSEDCNEHHHA